MATGPRKNTPKATVSPSARDLEWAAGFLEGEGSFIKAAGTQRVSAFQNSLEPLLKLKSFFGGTISPQRVGNQWQIAGARARGVMMTLFSLLSERRKVQIRGALGA